MASESIHGPGDENALPDEHGQEHTAVAEQSGGATQPWYLRLGEDWWATIAGLVLVALIVSRLLHAIP